jgi:hypothetical protein
MRASTASPLATRAARRRHSLPTTLSLAALAGVLTACATRDAPPAMPTSLHTLDSLSSDTRARLSSVRLLFGHQSVGRNVLSGIRELARSGPTVGLGIAPLDTSAPVPPGVSHFEVGTNGDPDSKGAAFARALSEQAADSVLAGYELCYLDFTTTSDADAIFANYQRVMEGVRARHPTVRLVHFTVPLTVEEPWAKGIVKRLLGRSTTQSLNAKRADFNGRMRAAYDGREPLFDLARAESTLEDGRRIATVLHGREVESLAPEFAADEGHLNERGRRIVASRFLAFLATLP